MGVMISFEEITAFLQRDLKQRYRIEIRFSVKGMAEYDFCWMGKMPDPANQAKDCYWYGLSPDGSQAYDYDNLDVFSPRRFLTVAPYGRSGKTLNWNRSTAASRNIGSPKRMEFNHDFQIAI